MTNETRLEHPNTFLDSIFDHIPNMVFVKDAKELRFVRFNKAGEELLGYSRQELMGKNDYDFFTKKEADFFTSKDREVLRSGKLYDIPEEPIHTRYKGVRILHTKKIPVMDDLGQPQYLLGISEDVTERKEMEKQILDISEREQRRIGQDLHDGLGQELTGISFLCKVLSQKLIAKGHKEADDAVQIANLLNQTVAHTRDLARLLYPMELKANGLLSALEELAASNHKMFRIECNFTTGPGVKEPSKEKAAHLYRIAQESVSNAIKHSKASEISIEMSHVKGTTHLFIKDNGIGFDPQRANNHGMGLSIMKHRAHMIGATIGFASNPTGGTLVHCSYSENEDMELA